MCQMAPYQASRPNDGKLAMFFLVPPGHFTQILLQKGTKVSKACVHLFFWEPMREQENLKDFGEA